MALGAGQSLDWWSLFAHLRLHYQLLFLSPLFAWGFLLGGGVFSVHALAAFSAFHVFLYGGMTAYNSYYDRDEGPVGGMRSPPPVHPALLSFSLAAQLVGLFVVALLDPKLTVLYLGFMLWSAAYSHPRLRWKAHPILSLLVIAIGQGAGGFAAGWLVGDSPTRSLLESTTGMLGLSAAALVTVGFYPLTQLYQVEEDRLRGDRTFSVVFGPKASFTFALLSLGLGCGCLVALLGLAFGIRHALPASAGACLLLLVLARWRGRFTRSVEENFAKVHALQLALSLCTLGYVALLLATNLTPNP